MSTILRRALSLLALTAVLVSASACATRPASNVLLLYYQAGSLENKEWAECIRPGKDGSYPIDDETYTILTDVRTWNIAREGGDTNTPIESGTKFGPDGQPGPAVKTWASADFVINSDCSADENSPVVRFWETLGRRYEISADNDENGWNQENWRKLLLNTFVVAQQKAIAEGTRFYTADELDSNGRGQRRELERRIAPLFQEELKAKLGGDFFCGVAYQVDSQGRAVDVEYDEYVADGVDDQGVTKYKAEKRKSKCPPVRISITDIDFANEAIAAARADVYAAEQRRKAALIAAQTELDKSNLLGQATNNSAYLEYKKIEAQVAAAEACKANPNCTVIIDGTGGAGIIAGTRK